MSVAPGTRIGPYEIVSMLGAGGMGEVYRARDTRLDRQVALKFLPSPFIGDPERRARFAREARLLATLNHPNIGSIHGLEEAGGLTALVLELVEGPTLADRLQHGPLKIAEALTIARQIAEALEAAHDKGIVHRDLKPANVVLQNGGASGRSGSDIRVKVLDFGLAKSVLLLDSDAPTVSPVSTFDRTIEGRILGTPTYMSPEQARGEAVDKRTDIWAFGCVLFEMLSGRRPFAANTASDVFARILEHEPDWSVLPAATPSGVRKLLERSLQKDLSRRLRDIGDARMELDDALGARPAAPQRRIGFAIAGRGRLLASAVVVLALGVTSGVWWWLSKSRDAGRSAGGAVVRNLSRLTFGPGLQTHATWSPDGRQIAFASDHAGNFDIWAQPVAGGDASQLTRSPAADTEPAWSPDGRSIVFRSEREGGGLFVVPGSGGPERQLTSFGVKPQWTPDGREILFRSSVFSSTSSTGIDATSGLYAVSSAGGEPPREILQSFLRGGNWNWIGSHPDGRISALGLHATSGHGFFTLSRDGRHVTRSGVAADLPLRLGNAQQMWAGTRVVRFQWNRTGSALYVEAIVNEVRGIWRVKVEPKTLQWLSAERLTTGAGADVALSVSRDDKQLLFTTEQHGSRLWVFPFDASAGTIIGKGTPVTPEQDAVTWSDLAPDGSRVAYMVQRAGSRQVDLWSVNVDGSGRELLAQNAIRGSWAPDGKAFAYGLRRVDSGESAIATRSRDGTEHLLSPWSRDSAFIATDWMPDGSALLGSYMSPVSSPAVLALWPTAKPASKPQRVSLSVDNTSLWQARFSPDARWIACVVQRHGGSQPVELTVARAVNGVAGELTRIAADHVWVDKPKWAPDGRTLYFLSRQHADDPFDLWGVRFDSDQGVVGTPFKVTHFDSPSQMISTDLGNTDIGIAERWAVLTLEMVTGNIWMLDNVDK